MNKLTAVTATLSLACASGAVPADIPVSVVSHNRGAIHVYLLCGDRDASFLGVVAELERGAFELPRSRARCASGLNFFLVTQDGKHGYWVGPFRPVAGQSVFLTIEKYAPLSSADLRWQ